MVVFSPKDSVSHQSGGSIHSFAGFKQNQVIAFYLYYVKFILSYQLTVNS